MIDSPPRPADRDEVHRQLVDHSIETVLCVIPDAWGRLMGKRLTRQTFLESALAHEGLHACTYLFQVDMEMNPRVKLGGTGWENGFPDFRLVPDISTFRILPWLHHTAIVICDAYHEDDDRLIAMAPRSILRQQLQAARELGLALKTASELEFYLYRTPTEDAWDRRYRGLTPVSYFNADYHILQSTKHDDVIGRLRALMTQAGIEIESSKMEGGRGQQEIALRYEDALEAADRHVLYKNGVKEISALEGMTACFMAKPSIDDYGSSCHIHASLWDTDTATPISALAEDGHELSPTMRAFLGGQLKSTRELCLMFAANVNSYKRLQPGSFAPTAVSWGRDNRSTAFRVVGHGRSLRLENRIPGADVNPYLATAAMISAGCDGIRLELDPGPPVGGDAYHDARLDQLPTTLSEAIGRFAKSELAARSLGEPVHHHLVELSRQELAAFEHECVTDWEQIRYFERI